MIVPNILSLPDELYGKIVKHISDARDRYEFMMTTPNVIKMEQRTGWMLMQ